MSFFQDGIIDDEYGKIICSLTLLGSTNKWFGFVLEVFGLQIRVGQQAGYLVVAYGPIVQTG